MADLYHKLDCAIHILWELWNILHVPLHNYAKVPIMSIPDLTKSWQHWNCVPHYPPISAVQLSYLLQALRYPLSFDFEYLSHSRAIHWNYTLFFSWGREQAWFEVFVILKGGLVYFRVWLVLTATSKLTEWERPWIENSGEVGAALSVVHWLTKQGHRWSEKFVWGSVMAISGVWKFHSTPFWSWSKCSFCTAFLNWITF